MKIKSTRLLRENVHRIIFDNGKTLYLVGTAHVSSQSVKLVEETVNRYAPDTICVELDEARHAAIMKKSAWEELDIVEIIRKKQLFFVIGQFILSSYQKKIAQKTGSAPGAEFKRAIELAAEKNIRLACVDRNIGVTLKRAWRLTTFRRKMGLLWALLKDDSDSITGENIEDLKSMDAITSLIGDFEKELPETKRVLIDERDRYLLGMTIRNLGEKTVAVVGAGHVPGIIRGLDMLPGDEELAGMEVIPPLSRASRVAPWVLPVLIVGFLAWGFSRGDYEAAKNMIGYWIMVTGSLAAIGSALALAHPLTILVGFLAAPVTTLHPAIGVGFFTALAQALLVRPRVRDLQQIQDMALSVTDWWRNRLTRIFLVFFLSSVGASIGTFVALPALLKVFN